MESLEDRYRGATSGKEAPPADLDFLAKPENYEGAQMSFLHFRSIAQKYPQENGVPPGYRTVSPSPIPSPAPGRSANVSDDEESPTKEAQPQHNSYSRRRSVLLTSSRGVIQLEVNITGKPSSESTDKKRRAGITPGSHPQSARVRELAKAKRMVWARNRFRHAIRTVIILLKWVSTLADKEDEDGKQAGRTFTEIASDAFSSDELKESGLTFDVSQFKAHREVNISSEAQNILSIPSMTRSPEQLQTALFGLQHLKSFAEYPLHMQEKLCKVAWFQEVPPKRVIIRQGHYAENFYFILSGQALVRILERHPQTGEPYLRTATIMRKGTSFGELALLHHSRRTATVVSQDTVQLLTIGRDDFFDIFMGGNAPGEIPEHIKFCSSLDFMKDWPIEKLLQRPECCLFHFYKRGVVVVKDSNQSDWLYIVKSGSCQVMKQLKGVVPKMGGVRPVFTREQTLQEETLFSHGSPAAKVDTGIRRPHTRARACRTPTPVLDSRKHYSSFTTLHNLSTSLKQKSEVRFACTEDDSDSGDASKGAISKGPGFSQSRYKFNPGFHKAHFMASKLEATPMSKSVRQTTSQEVNQNMIDSGALKGPVFVQVHVLKPKDVFGLTTIKFDEDVSTIRTSVSLVSNGAECIMLSKKFFIEHSNEMVRKMIRHQLRHYPTEATLQENLQTKVDWDLYKRMLIKDTLKKRHRRNNWLVSV